MITDANPYDGAVARNLKEMREISENSRKFERTGDNMEWRSVRTKEVVYTNL